MVLEIIMFQNNYQKNKTNKQQNKKNPTPLKQTNKRKQFTFHFFILFYGLNVWGFGIE